MSATDTTMPGPPPEPGPDKGVNAAGWLGSQSIFDRPDERKLGRAMATSFVVHGLLIAGVFFVLLKAPEAVQQTVPMVYNVFFKQDPGPGGGGGGTSLRAGIDLQRNVNPNTDLDFDSTKPTQPALNTPAVLPVTPTTTSVASPVFNVSVAKVKEAAHTRRTTDAAFTNYDPLAHLVPALV